MYRHGRARRSKFRRRSLAVAAAALVGGASTLAAGPHADAGTSSVAVAEYLTTADLSQTMTRQPTSYFTLAPPPSGAEPVTVDPGIHGQPITAGFGVAMTDTSAWLIGTKLSSSTRTDVLRKLFSPTAGIGLSFVRVPIGGSDYVVKDLYTYDDMPSGQTDPYLEHFSIDHDRPYILPVLRQALKENPQISIMMNPWSPPAWMKEDDTLTTYGPYGLYPQYYGVYARYLVKTLQAYAAAGVRVNYLGVQNEPGTALINVLANIPASYITGAEEGVLIKDYVAPELAAAGLRTKVLAFDDSPSAGDEFVKEAETVAGPAIDGIAYHCYSNQPSQMQADAQLYPGVEQLVTECSMPLAGLAPAQETIRNLRYGAQGFQLWNAALDQKGGPKTGTGCGGTYGPGITTPDCTAPVTVDTTTGGYRLTSDYWTLGHFSKFIQRGAIRLGSNSADCSTTQTSCNGVEDVAFQNPDGSHVLVVTSTDGSPHTISVNENGKQFSTTLPPKATATFVWTPASSS